MRFLLALLLWIVTTAGLTVSVAALWAQHTLVSEDGYAALAASAAQDPALQQATAAELGAQLLTQTGASEVQGPVLDAALGAYTASSAFPGQFATVNRFAHRWLFTDTARRSDQSGRWVVDLAPILADGSIKQTLSEFGVQPPTSLQVPLTENVSENIRPGQLRLVAVWGPWASVGIAVLTGIFALLTLVAARSRGKSLAALGISALLVGAAGWAGIEVGRRFIDDGLNRSTGDVHAIADVMVDHAISNLHLWLNLTLTVGGGLVVIGVIVALLGALGRSGRDDV